MKGIKLDSGVIEMVVPGMEERRWKEGGEYFDKGLEAELSKVPDFARAEEMYLRSLEVDPQNSSSMVNLGTIYFNKHQNDAAEKMYRRALAIDPFYALAHFDLANLLDETCRQTEAKYHYEQALLFQHDYPDAHYNYALLLQNEGDLFRALKHWSEYLKIAPHSNWSSIAKREIARIKKKISQKGKRDLIPKPATSENSANIKFELIKKA